MRTMGIALLAIALWTGAASAQVSLRIDASQASAILEAYDAQDASAVHAITAMRPTLELIAHHAPFSDLVTIEHYGDSLRDALSGAPRRDLWGFNRLARDSVAIQASISAINADPAAFAADIERIIAPYTPDGILLVVDVGFVIGTPGAGWTDRPSEFFFDVGRAAGDIEGAKVVCAHELFHLVMAQLQPTPRLPENTRLGQLERVLFEAVDEGMATHVGRFVRGDTGALSSFNLGVEQTNLRRMQQNFRLVDALILALMSTTTINADDLSVIALGGAFDEPGYYVFREMASVIEAQRGRDVLLTLVTQPPSRFVLEYHAVAPPEAPRLHADTLAAVRALDERLLRAR